MASVQSAFGGTPAIQAQAIHPVFLKRSVNNMALITLLVNVILIYALILIMLKNIRYLFLLYCCYITPLLQINQSLTSVNMIEGDRILYNFVQHLLVSVHNCNLIFNLTFYYNCNLLFLSFL